MTHHARGHHRGTATAKEITHEDVEMVRRFGAAFLTVVFELPLSDVTVVDGERAAFDCRVTATPAAEVPWYVDNVEFRQTDDCRIVFTAKELIEQESTGVTVTVRIRPDDGLRRRSPRPYSLFTACLQRHFSFRFGTGHLASQNR